MVYFVKIRNTLHCTFLTTCSCSPVCVGPVGGNWKNEQGAEIFFGKCLVSLLERGRGAHNRTTLEEVSGEGSDI